MGFLLKRFPRFFRIWVVVSLQLLISSSYHSTFVSTAEIGATQDGTTNRHISIAGYLPDYRSIDLNHTVSHISDLILFSLEVHSRGMVGGCCLQKQHYENARLAKEHYNSKLILWVTVGGQGRANGWQEVCHDTIKRNRFIDSMIRLCSREGIQGIDLDWFSSIRTFQDTQYFLEFLQQASPLWHQQGLSLSIPLHVGQKLPHWAYDLVDRVNLMVYDSPFVGSETVKTMDHQQYQYRVAYAQRGLDSLMESGCPAHKIWIGIPFFGSQWNNPGMTLTFREALEQSHLSSHVLLDDMEQHLFGGYQWDSPPVIREKMKFVNERGLGGVFIWELGQDSPSQNQPAGILLEALVAMSSREGTSSPETNDEL